MSWLSRTVKKVGKVAGKVGKVVGSVASKAAPLIGMTGVGAPLAALIGGGGALLAGENVGTALKRGALGAAGGLAGGTVRGLIGGAGKKLLGGGTPAPLDMGSIGNQAVADSGGLASAVAPAAGRSLLGRIGGAVGDAGGAALRYAGQHPATVLQGGLAALGTIQGAQQQGEADASRRQALDLGLGEAEVQPGSLTGYTDPGNPYTRGASTGSARLSALRALMGRRG